MKTKSIRARIGDVEILEQASRVLAVKLQRKVTVSEIINEIMEDLENAKKRIEKRNDEIS